MDVWMEVTVQPATAPRCPPTALCRQALLTTANLGEGRAGTSMLIIQTLAQAPCRQVIGIERPSCPPQKVTQPCRESCPRGPQPPEGPLKALPTTERRWLGRTEGVQEGPLRPLTQLPERTLSSLRLSTCHPSAALNSPPAREQGLPQIPGSRA